MSTSHGTVNRFGFLVLGLTNNFAYVVMLTAAYDLLEGTKRESSKQISDINSSTNYCNSHSTSTILLADTIPALITKLSYPFLLLKLPSYFKVVAVALLSATSFLLTGFANSETVIFTGVICASFSSGLGEATYLSNIPSYGDTSLSGWSMGTGAAGLLGAVVYALLRLVLSIEIIMLIMMIIPISMLIAYFCVIKIVIDPQIDQEQTFIAAPSTSPSGSETDRILRNNETEARNYGTSQSTGQMELQPFDLRAKICYMPTLIKYFFPLLLVYFAEYFINQGLFELIYYPEITMLDHATQYSWFQVSYQLGVMISRSSLDLFKIRQLWLMSMLQLLNAILFLAHAAKLVHLPNFHLVILLIIYEGLLGGFTYTNTYHRLKNELPIGRRGFSMSVVTIADTLGIVTAGIIAIPTHDALCKLY